MSTPLLQVRKLTLRFGGLTAVSEVDLNVEVGEIAAVIGPNGAGKTSLFNAITGIYEPTSGDVLLAGRDVQIRRQPRDIIRWLATGLSLGLLTLLAAANVDSLWAAVIKGQDPQTYEFSQGVTALGDYLMAQPRVEARIGKQFVVSHDGQIQFAIAKTRQEAEPILVKIAQKIADGDADPVIQQAAAAAHAARRFRVLAFLIGSAVGTAAAYSIWRRTRRTPTSVALQGIARTFQNIRLFHNMTVLENVLVAMDRHLQHRVKITHPTRRTALVAPVLIAAPLLGLSLVVRGEELNNIPVLATVSLVALFVVILGYLISMTRRGAFTAATQVLEATARAEAIELLRFVGLEQKADLLSRNLAYGEQRRLEIARALGTRPQLLLLDEPAAGMNPSESMDLMALIRSIRDRGVTVLLIEHHMRVVMGISDRITVLVHGKRIAEGTPDEIRKNIAVIEAYLGAEEEV